MNPPTPRRTPMLTSLAPTDPNAALVSDEFLHNPYPLMAWMQAEAPVFWSDSIGAWIVTRYDDVQVTFKVTRQFSNEGGWARRWTTCRQPSAPTLPDCTCTLLSHFRSHFSKRIWSLALVLLIGAILVPNKRTVTACLRIVGLQGEKRFLKYHRVLSRAVWSSLAVSQTLLLLLVSTFAATGTLIIGVDDTIERRWGLKIRARGIYRDPVRSSHSHFVKASGLRWLCAMLLVPIPWAQRV